MKKLEKHTIILVFQKVTQLVARVLMVTRKNKKLIKVKPQQWYTESFMSLTISNIRTTVSYFENIKLLK